jgi:flagellar hook-associated protein 3 FlgL
MTTITNSGSNLHITGTRQRIMTDLNKKLEVAGQEVATGMRADVFAHLRTRANESISLRGDLARSEFFVSQNTLLEQRLGAVSDTLSTMRRTTQSLMDLVVPNATSPSGTASEIQVNAEAVMNAFITQANLSFNNSSLFSGVASDRPPLQEWDKANPTTGFSPQDLMNGVVGGVILNEADAIAKIAQVEAIFSDDPAQPAGQTYQETFFNGAPNLDALGNPVPRQSALIAEGSVLEYGVQANDKPFRDVLKGMAMLSSVDVIQIQDRQAYQAWVKTAMTSIAEGMSGMSDISTRVGGFENLVDDAKGLQLSRIDIYESRILDLEGVDPYEAVTRMTQLETTLQATYQVSARLSQLSFLNYL